jgi:hypothetical protein
MALRMGYGRASEVLDARASGRPVWRKQGGTDRGMPLQPISDAAAKRDLLACLVANWREGIRLPRDLIVNHRLFVEHILSLPDTPDTPPFTAEDFDALSRTGETAEFIRRFEQQVGRRVRLKDGQESWSWVIPLMRMTGKVANLAYPSESSFRSALTSDLFKPLRE